MRKELSDTSARLATSEQRVPHRCGIKLGISTWGLEEVLAPGFEGRGGGAETRGRTCCEPRGTHTCTHACTHLRTHLRTHPQVQAVERLESALTALRTELASEVCVCARIWVCPCGDHTRWCHAGGFATALKLTPFFHRSNEILSWRRRCAKQNGLPTSIVASAYTCTHAHACACAHMCARTLDSFAGLRRCRMSVMRHKPMARRRMHRSPHRSVCSATDWLTSVCMLVCMLTRVLVRASMLACVHACLPVC